MSDLVADQIIVSKDNIEECKKILLNNIQMLVINFVQTKEVGVTIFERNILFNILFAKNVIESIEDNDLLELIEDVNLDISDIIQLKMLDSLPENHKYN